MWTGFLFATTLSPLSFMPQDISLNLCAPTRLPVSVCIVSHGVSRKRKKEGERETRTNSLSRFSMQRDISPPSHDIITAVASERIITNASRENAHGRTPHPFSQACLHFFRSLLHLKAAGFPPSAFRIFFRFPFPMRFFCSVSLSATLRILFSRDDRASNSLYSRARCF